MIALLLACAAGPADPRAAIRAGIVDAGPAPESAVVEERVLLGELPAACTNLRARLRADDSEEDWRLLLRVRARGAGDVCLAAADAAALAAWAHGRPGWRGARAEWLAAAGRIADAEALLAEPGEEVARLRVALARGDGDGARAAAEGALLEEPRDVLACRTLALSALEEQDAAWAIELARCGELGPRAPALARLEGAALDLAGEHAAAEAVYRRVGATVHLAALLYQEDPTPERRAEAARLLEPGPEGRPPAAALHAGWLALVEGRPVPLDELDDSLPALIQRALARGSAEDVAALERAASAPTAIARARVHARRGDHAATEAALDDALRAAPASEPVHRARIALRLAAGGDVDAALVDWVAQDPDHVAIVGVRGARDVPWGVIVPETWAALAMRRPDPRMRADAPRGADAIGDRVRAARQLVEAGARADALGALAREVPGLDALPAERYRLGPPPPAGAPDRVP